MKKPILCALVGAVVLATATFSCHKAFKMEKGMVWNTMYNITYDGPESLRDSITLVFNEVGRSLSFFETNSILSQVNANTRTLVDSNFIKVYSASRQVFYESHGAFDPTLAPAITAWGFGTGHTPTADTARIAEIMKYVGFDSTDLRGDTLVKFDNRTTFNFSAVAKGYGCDCIADMFRRNGVSDFLIEVGGEISAGGKNPQGGKWVIAVDVPDTAANNREIMKERLYLSDCGVATSGNYRNFHKSNGEAYGHTIDPKTGHPVKTDVLSATVIAPTTMMADAYATACMVLGSTQALEMAKRYDIAIMIVTAEGVYKSPAITKYLEK